MSLVNASVPLHSRVRTMSRGAIKNKISKTESRFTMATMMFEHSIWRLNALMLLMVLTTDRTAAFLPLPFQTIKQNGVSLKSLSPSTSKTNCRNTRLFLSSKNWDKIIEDDEDEDADENDGVPFDMQYNERNVVRQNKNFLAIREAAGNELTNDLYCRDPKSNIFWFIGKVARVSDVTVDQAVTRQWPMINEHASNLRPIELFPARKFLELWAAPGDSEMQVVYNDPNLIFRKMERKINGADAVKNTMVGYQGELYQAGEEGFRTTRKEDGRPDKPEMTPPGNEDAGGRDEPRQPTEEEMDQIRNAMEGKDINDFYEEQQRREGKELDE